MKVSIHSVDCILLGIAAIAKVLVESQGRLGKRKEQENEKDGLEALPASQES